MTTCYIHILIKISRDKAFERLCKLEKGKISGRLTTIRKRDWESMKLSLVTKDKDKEWHVKSLDKKQEYDVVCEHKKCPHDCQLVCNYCHVCIHMYTCTCMDFLINHTICKHIHLISFHQVGNSTGMFAGNKQQCMSTTIQPKIHIDTATYDK